jgi:DNA sulfur modification protein DndD
MKVRQEVGSLIPELCSQFISLIISSERPGFVDSLLAAAPSDIQFWTAFRKTPGTNDLVHKLPKKGVLQTNNGVLVEGQKYFMEFDLDSQI